jgi:hypothetical protein
VDGGAENGRLDRPRPWLTKTACAGATRPYRERMRKKAQQTERGHTLSRIRTMSHRGVALIGLFIVSVALGALVAGTAAAADPTPVTLNGGGTIAAAPELPLGQQIASDGSSGDEFWRVQLNAGDRLVIDWAVPAVCTCGGKQIDVYNPSVTDYTVPEAKATVQSKELGGCCSGFARNEFVWVAPFPGEWTLAFANNAQLAYTVIANVQRFTQTQVSAPTLVKHARPFTVGGGVSTAAVMPTNSKVALTVNGLGLSKPLKMVVALTSDGRFATHLRLPRTGTYTLRVTYYGDASHRASAATAKIHVG